MLQTHPNPDTRFKLIAECNSCKSTSVIELTIPELKIEFGEGNDGCLCDMKPNS